jgi:hypothetical protein
MKPFQNSNIILNIVAFFIEELRLKDLILPAPKQKGLTRLPFPVRFMRFHYVQHTSQMPSFCIPLIHGKVTGPTARGKSPWHAAFSGVPIFIFILPDHRLCIVKNVGVCVYIKCIEIVYESPSLPDNTVVKCFYTNRSGAKCRQGIYH